MGPWEEHPLGSGLLLVFIAAPIALLCLLACGLLTRELYLWFSPPGSGATVAGSLIE